VILLKHWRQSPQKPSPSHVLVDRPLSLHWNARGRVYRTRHKLIFWFANPHYCTSTLGLFGRPISFSSNARDKVHRSRHFLIFWLTDPYFVLPHSRTSRQKSPLSDVMVGRPILLYSNTPFLMLWSTDPHHSTATLAAKQTEAVTFSRSRLPTLIIFYSTRGNAHRNRHGLMFWLPDPHHSTAKLAATPTETVTFSSSGWPTHNQSAWSKVDRSALTRVTRLGKSRTSGPKVLWQSLLKLSHSMCNALSNRASPSPACDERNQNQFDGAGTGKRVEEKENGLDKSESVLVGPRRQG